MTYNTQDQCKDRWIPVVSSTGKPLMPCHPSRARKLVAKGKVVKKWLKGFFYIQLLDREDGDTQEVCVGVDPGSKREGFTVLSSTRTFLNINTHARDGKAIKKSIEGRVNARRARRGRNTPCRPPRFNNRFRKGWVPPSTKARWQLKLNIVKHLMRLYPVTKVAVEDVVAISVKSGYRWNNNFSPIQIGKNYFYRELGGLGLTLTQFKGIETAALRNALGLRKTSSKLAEVFSAHCVDSWVLANKVLGQRTTVDLTELVTLIPLTLTRRQLHVFNLAKGGVRRRQGSTLSLGVQKGTLCYHPKWGKCYLGGNDGDKSVSLHDYTNTKRLAKNVKLDDTQVVAHSPWRVIDSFETTTPREKRIRRLNTLCIKLAVLGVSDSRVFHALKSGTVTKNHPVGIAG